MTRLDVLKRFYNEAMNEVFKMSANWLMDTPKPGYEKPWRDAQETAAILEELIKENGGSVNDG